MSKEKAALIEAAKRMAALIQAAKKTKKEGAKEETVEGEVEKD